MARTITELRDIVRLGGSLIIDAAPRTPTELRDLASIAHTSGATIIFRNTDGRTATELKDLTRLAPNRLIFEL